MHNIIHRDWKKTPPPLNNMLQHAQYITQSNDTYTA